MYYPSIRHAVTVLPVYVPTQYLGANASCFSQTDRVSYCLRCCGARDLTLHGRDETAAEKTKGRTPAANGLADASTAETGALAVPISWEMPLRELSDPQSF